MVRAVSFIVANQPRRGNMTAEILYYLWATLLVLASCAALVATILTLPGNWAIVVFTGLFAWCYPPENGHGISWIVVVVLAILAGLGELVEFAAGAAGAAKQGASRRAMLLAVVGAVAGSLTGAILGSPVPILGNIAGALGGGALGAFGGAYLGEVWKGRTSNESLYVGQAAFAGRLLGTVGKLILGAMIFLATLPWSRPWLPAWMVVVILSRELLVTGIRGYVESVGGEFPADRFGKLKMIVQCIAVGALLWLHAFDWPQAWFDFWSVLAHVLVWATLVATVGSGATYVLKTGRILAEVQGGEDA